jgi:hypothetical protein
MMVSCHHLAASLRDQPRGALVAGVDPEPAQCDAQPVAEADQEVDVGDAPYPPCDGAAQLDAAEIDHRQALADLRKAAGMLVAERARRGAAQARSYGFGDVAALLLGGRCDAGHRLAVPGVDADGVADRKDLGMAGNGEVGFDLHAPGAVAGGAQPFGRGRSAHAGGPDSGLRLEQPAAEHDALAIDLGDGLAEHDLDADLFQRRLGIGREVVGKSCEHARARLDQHHARLVRVDVAEIAGQGVMRHLGDGAGELDAGRAGSDDDEGQPRRALLRIGLALGAFERHQDVPAQRGRILQRFQAGRELLPLVVAEIGVPRAGGEHQRVVGHLAAVVDQHAATCRVDAAHGGKQRRHLAAITHEMADRPGDLAGCERGGRDLVEQRLEQMMIAAVDQRDLDGSARKPVGRFQPAEAGADDDDAMGICGHDAPSNLAAAAHLHLSADWAPRSNSRHQSLHRPDVSIWREKAPQP